MRLDYELLRRPEADILKFHEYTLSSKSTKDQFITILLLFITIHATTYLTHNQ